MAWIWLIMLLRPLIIWIGLINHKLFWSISMRALSRKWGQIIIWMVKIGLKWVPNFITEVLKLLGIQTGPLVIPLDHLIRPIQAQLRPTVHKHELQTDLGPSKLGPNRSSPQVVAILMVVQSEWSGCMIVRMEGEMGRLCCEQRICLVSLRQMILILDFRASKDFCFWRL